MKEVLKPQGQTFNFTDLFHRYIDMADEAFYSRAPDHTTALELISMYQIFRNSQCSNDLVRARIYDLETLTTSPHR